MNFAEKPLIERLEVVAEWSKDWGDEWAESAVREAIDEIERLRGDISGTIDTNSEVIGALRIDNALLKAVLRQIASSCGMPKPPVEVLSIIAKMARDALDH